MEDLVETSDDVVELDVALRPDIELKRLRAGSDLPDRSDVRRADVRRRELSEIDRSVAPGPGHHDRDDLRVLALVRRRPARLDDNVVTELCCEPGRECVRGCLLDRGFEAHRLTAARTRRPMFAAISVRELR